MRCTIAALRSEGVSRSSLLWLLVIAAYPLWWVLGAEQFVPPVASVIAAIAVLPQVKRKPLPSLSALYLTFLLWQVVSLTQVETAERFLSWAKNWLTYAGGGAAALLVAVTVTRSSLFAAAVIRVLAVLGGVVGILSLLHSFLGVEISFVTPLGLLIPNDVLSHQYPSLVFIKTIGKPLPSFWGFPRSSGLFLFPNEAGLFCLATAVLQGYLAARARARAGKAAWAAALILSLVGFVGAVSRSSLVAGVVFGITAALLLILKRKTKLPCTLRVAILLVSTVLAFPAFRLAHDLALKRLGSLSYRLRVVSYSLRALLQKPLVGWGTQLDYDQVYPNSALEKVVTLGSHSDYLAVLFRFGIVGLTLYLLFIGTVVGRGIRTVLTMAEDSTLPLLATGLVCAFAIQGLFIELALDAFVFLTVAILWGIVLGFAASTSGEEEESHLEQQQDSDYLHRR